MYVDRQLRMSNSQAVTATAPSTDQIDFSKIRNMGVGESLYVVVVCTVAMTDASSDSTVTVTLETDDNDSFGSATVAQTLGTFPALSAQGSRLVAKLQPDKINERYLRANYTVANGNLTTGSFTTFITKDIQAYTSYPNGYTITG